VRAVVIIPARYESTRLPGKMLLSETGKYLVQHVYERALEARLPEQVLIATDDERILDAATAFGAQAAITGKSHRTGTERVAEVAAGVEAEIVVNLQGDEPLIDPVLIDRLVEALQAEREIDVATAAYRLDDPDTAADPNLVKVVLDKSGNALYFSRNPLPYYQNDGEQRIYFGHVGIYAYRREFLLAFAGMEQTPLEKAEKLEQLRVLESGYRIKVIQAERAFSGIDTRQDYDSFVREWKRETVQE
jgi:3-deoxy-manno-octulosonate cytidylyltransferase (CMP-KDO synthetase)